MNTITHVLINGSIDRAVRRRTTADEHPIATKPFLLGGLAPDVPLIALTGAAFAWFSGVRGWPAGETFRYVFDELFFTHPGWIAAHNVLQAPLILLAAIGAAVALRRRWPGPARTLGWFFAGCAVHVAGDIPVHHDDGPLLLFPFDWQVRFHSPISYWDPARHADIVRPLEIALVAALAAYLLWPVVRRRWRSASATGDAGVERATGGSTDSSPGGEPGDRADDSDTGT